MFELNAAVRAAMNSQAHAHHFYLVITVYVAMDMRAVPAGWQRASGPISEVMPE